MVVSCYTLDYHALRFLESAVIGNFECLSRFDYGALKLWIRQVEDHFVAMGGSTGLLIPGDYCFSLDDRHCLSGTWGLTHLSLIAAAEE